MTRKPDPSDPIPPLGLLAGGILVGMSAGSVPLGILIGVAGAAAWKRWAREKASGGDT
jgi:hypothetical protein